MTAYGSYIAASFTSIGRDKIRDPSRKRQDAWRTVSDPSDERSFRERDLQCEQSYSLISIYCFHTCVLLIKISVDIRGRVYPCKLKMCSMRLMSAETSFFLMHLKNLYSWAARYHFQIVIALFSKFTIELFKNAAAESIREVMFELQSIANTDRPGRPYFKKKLSDSPKDERVSRTMCVHWSLLRTTGDWSFTTRISLTSWSSHMMITYQTY